MHELNCPLPLKVFCLRCHKMKEIFHSAWWGWGGHYHRDWCLNELAMCCTGGRNHLWCEGAHHGGQSAGGWEWEPSAAGPGGQHSANWKHPEAIRFCKTFQLPYCVFWMDENITHWHRTSFDLVEKFELLQSESFYWWLNLTKYSTRQNMNMHSRELGNIIKNLKSRLLTHNFLIFLSSNILLFILLLCLFLFVHPVVPPSARWFVFGGVACVNKWGLGANHVRQSALCLVHPDFFSVSLSVFFMFISLFELGDSQWLPRNKYRRWGVVWQPRASVRIVNPSALSLSTSIQSVISWRPNSCREESPGPGV